MKMKIIFNTKTLFLISFTLMATTWCHSQKIKVIDNKGTINESINITVTTTTSQPSNPLHGDVWIDSNTNTSYIL